MTDTATLIAQLRVVAHLTRAQAQGARLRVLQATGDDVAAVLQRTASDADARAARVAAVLRDLGAVPDPVTPVLGRVAALVRGAVEQAQPLDEALLGDLTLEHHLRDRARYVAALADAAGLPAVRTLADDLGAGHDAHAAWLGGILVGLADGAATPLDASPLQRVAAQVTRAANAPGRAALEYAARVAQPGAEAADTGAGPVEVGAPDGTGEGATGAAAEPASDTDDGAGNGIAAAPATAPPGPPVPGFADLPAHAAIAALRTVETSRGAAAALAFEQAHGGRPAVLAAARIRMEALEGA